MDIKNQILENLKVKLDEEKVPARVENGTLSVLFQDFSDEPMEVYADFFFAESPLGEDTAIFHSVFTVLEGASAEQMEALHECADILNFYVEMGAFSGDVNDKAFVYRSSVLVDISADEEALTDHIYLNAAMAMAVAGRYVDLFIKVALGLMDIDEVKGLVAGE